MPQTGHGCDSCQAAYHDRDFRDRVSRDTDADGGEQARDAGHIVRPNGRSPPLAAHRPPEQPVDSVAPISIGGVHGRNGVRSTDIAPEHAEHSDGDARGLLVSLRGLF